METKPLDLGTYRSERRTEQIDKLARQYTPALKRYFARHACIDASTDDLVQEVFKRLAGRKAGNAIRNAEAFLIRTAQSVRHDHMRRIQSRSLATHVEYEEKKHAIGDFSPERVYIGKDRVNHVFDALQELPPRTRDVFILCRFEGLKQYEVAEQLELSTASIYTHLKAAITHLAARLGD
ncbi:MAG: RNA polymerase sigma factor [Pseudomonadota bacterium]